jgi:hypothetical protein
MADAQHPRQEAANHAPERLLRKRLAPCRTQDRSCPG